MGPLLRTEDRMHVWRQMGAGRFERRLPLMSFEESLAAGGSPLHPGEMTLAIRFVEVKREEILLQISTQPGQGCEHIALQIRLEALSRTKRIEAAVAKRK